MTRRFFLTVAAVILACAFVNLASTAPAQAKGQVCHMEQQCHWENFKKVCVWVKVCR